MIEESSGWKDVAAPNWPTRPRSRKPVPKALRDLRTQVESLSVANNEMLADGYLSRLRRLLRLRRDHYDELNDQGLRLLDRSIFAAFCDCVDIGQTKAAKDVLKNVRLTLAFTESRSVRKGDKV